MAIFLVAFLLMLLLVSGMAVGVIAGRKPIQGSCGGLKTIGVACDCETPCERRLRAEREQETVDNP